MNNYIPMFFTKKLINFKISKILILNIPSTKIQLLKILFKIKRLEKLN